jgi:superfamily I DNA/RNA helicase
MTPTKEQELIVTAAKSGENLTIQAFAGTGKTSTLLLAANEVLKPSLYMAYNKAMADEAKEKFPSHVEVRTSHSLAYAHVGNQYRHKLQRPKGAYKNLCGTGSEVGKYFKLTPIELTKDKSLSVAAIGLCIRDTVNKFEHSDAQSITFDHIPYHLISDFKKRKGFVESTFKSLVVKWAKKLWELRKDVDSPILCTHDTYMKIFQLSKPKLSGYEVIYLDEAADTNSCLLDIFLNQDCQKILVGDVYQSIYQWRGSVNAMSMTQFKELNLTQSFRFGTVIGDVATKILRDKYTGEFKAKVKGLDSLESQAHSCMTIGTNDLVYPYTMLYRTNATLLSQAVELIKRGVRLNIETDMSDFVKLLTSAVALFKCDVKNVKHESIVPFNTWQDLLTETSSNPELTRVAKIIKDGVALEYIRVLETHYNVPDPDITLTTAHKSKGREWDTVVLADDFPSIYDKSGVFTGLDDQERNLLYVAATRAKKDLLYNLSVLDMLHTNEVVDKE